MPAGMQIFLDDGGDVQIDDNFFNLALSGKYSVACSPSSSYTHGSLTVSGTSPIVAFSGPGYVCLNSMSQSGTSFTFNFMVNTAQTITVYVFDVPTSVGTYGLQVFDDNGKITFDSSRPYMKIVKTIDFNDYNSLLGSPQPLPIAGRKYAILQSQYNGYKFGRPFTPGESGPTFFEVEINTVMGYVDTAFFYTGEFMTFRATTGLGIQQPWEYARYSGQIQIIDVTNI